LACLAGAGGLLPKSKVAQSLLEGCLGYYALLLFDEKPKSKEKGLNKLIATFKMMSWVIIF
jgi:hypothetical protein